MDTVRKIGGWLVLLGLQIATTILFAIRELKIYFNFFQTADWMNITNLKDSTHWRTMFIFEACFYLFLFAGSFIILILFLSKKQRFRDFYSLYMILCTLGYIITYFIAKSIENIPVKKFSDLNTAIFGYIIWSAIWISYLYKAERPGKTFIN